ncbi:ATP-binding protein [Hymenobacter latericus]|uniref:ATP-binding protein n=1 Tax=Hymenobacter sp. YIM 151858-1 TaxID=2987688 RepID=UPI00222654AB|nr:ATP-binding protein [Hymenobacter sp. YIM 151858-1]UYZ58034.1 DeoR family transcriptional regulator [Hymenobacter sp. YIM 151858-1]
MSRIPSASPVSRQLNLFDATPVDDVADVATLLSNPENQWFDRKSSRIEPGKLAECMIGLANADGGRIAIGISQGVVEGINAYERKINDLIQAGRDHADPPVRSAVRYLDCLNQKGNPDKILILDVEASEHIHRTPRGKCFLRVGDETRELGPTEERELAFDKREASFDDSIVPGLTQEDLNMAMVEEYARRMGSRDINTLMRSRSIFRSQGSRPGVTQAGRLVFGLDTPVWCYVRYLRYDGTVAETGVRSNLLEDVRLEGTIPELIEQTQQLLRDQIPSVIRQTGNGRFARVPSLPEFAWLEAVVNALTHRSYSLQGDGVHVRQFSDRLEVQSPGRLPGLVRVQNIQNARFSRNPHIARILAEMTNYVRELNEGVRRMFQEMKQSGLREPEYRISDSHVCVILYKQVSTPVPVEQLAELNPFPVHVSGRVAELLPQLMQLFKHGGYALSTGDVAQGLKVSHATARGYLNTLAEQGLLRHDATTAKDPQGRWTAVVGLSDESIKNVVDTASRSAAAKAKRLAFLMPQLHKLFQQNVSMSTGEVALALGVSHGTARKHLARLAEQGMLRREASAPKDPQGCWVFIASPEWERQFLE